MDTLPSEQVVGFVTESLLRLGRSPEDLLQHLVAVQHRFSHVPDAAIELLSRELGVSASRLAQWRDQALLGAQGSLKAQPRDAAQEELGRLRHKVGELTMDNELLEERLRRLGDSAGPRSRRSGR